MRRRSVLLVSHYYEPHVGGIEAVVRSEARALAARELEVTVLTSSCGARRGRHTMDGATVRRVRAWNPFEDRWGVPYPLLSPLLLLAMWRAVRRADVVHVHEQQYETSWAAALCCRLTGTPYVLTQHVGIVDHPSRLVLAVQHVVHRTLGALVLGGARAVLPINAFIAQTLASRVESELEVVGNGVDVDRYHPAAPGERAEVRRELGIAADERVVLFVGRFVPKKGVPMVLAAASPAYRLVFAGGDRPPHVPADAGHVFLGSLGSDEVARVYRAADAYVGASVGECPLTVLEAMASGLPVVLNDDPGYHAIGADGPGVHYVDMAAGHLRQELEDLVGDPARLGAQAEAARATAVGAFSWSAHADQLQDIYERAAA